MSSFNNTDDVMDFTEKYAELRSMVVPIAKRLAKLHNIKDIIDEDNIYIDEYGDIRMKYEVHIGCGEWEPHNKTIPAEYLFDDSFITKDEEQKRIDEEKARLERQKKAAADKERAAAAKYEKYLKLKEEFEGGDE